MDMEINIELEIGRDDFPAFYAKIDKSYVRQNTETELGIAVVKELLLLLEQLATSSQGRSILPGVA